MVEWYWICSCLLVIHFVPHPSIICLFLLTVVGLACEGITMGVAMVICLHVNMIEISEPGD